MTMTNSKICTKCQNEKLLTSFSRKGKGLTSNCKDCAAEYGKQHYKANKALYMQRARTNGKKLIERNRKVIEEYKSSKPCLDCGKIFPPCAMDFDHLDNTKKISSVCRMMLNSVSLEKLFQEIEKCELVCAVCHRIRTHNRRK